jgi:hypothetical protein
MAIDEQALLAAIDAGRENAYGSDEQSTLGQKRARAIEYYLGLNKNPAPEGRSQIVDRSVYETISVMLPSLVRIFAGSSDEVCKAQPIGPEDEEAAEQQTAVLNYVVTQQNQWEQFAADWVHDAMLLCNGYAMAYWDESKNLVREVYEKQSDDQVQAIVSDKSVKVLEHSESVDEQATAEQMQQFQAQMQQYQQAAQMAAMQGMQLGAPPPPPQPVVLHDLVIEREENEGKVCIKVLPPEHCYVSADTPDWTLRDCPFFEFRQQKTIAELRGMGLEVDEGVSDDETNDRPEDWARDRFGEDTQSDENKGVMRRVWARMIWVRADAEGDGESRLYYAILVGRTVLFSQPVARIPVASMTPQPLPHRHIGMSVGETIHDIQDIKTAVKRGGLDNLYLANNGRNVISSKVNLSDFLDSRPGGVVRMLDDSLPAEGHVLPMVHPFAFDQIIQSLEYFDQERQNRSGASRYFSGTDAGAINKTASGTMALQNMASMRIEHTARMMAPAVEALFSAVQEIISKHQNKEMTIKLRGKWTTVDPQAWRTKRDMRISVGVGAGNKDSMLQQLGMVYGAQMQLMPLGIAGPEQIHATVTEMGKLQGFANPAKFWIDPSQNPPPPPPPDPEMVKVQIEAQAKQQDAQLKQQQAQADIQFKAQEAQIELEKSKVELQIKLAELEIKRQELELKAQAAMVDQQLAQQKTQHELQRGDAELGLKERDLGMQHMQKERELEQKERSTPEGLDSVVKKAVAEVSKVIEGGRTVGIERVRDPKTNKLVGARRKLADGRTEDVNIA